MKMPTTRYERYLFYRRRALRRLRFMRRRNVRKSLGDLGIAHRGFDLSGYGFQAPKKYPKIVGGEVEGSFFGSYAVHPSNERGAFPVAKCEPGTIAHLLTQHFHARVIGYHERRVLRVPRVKHVPKLPVA